MMFVCFSKLDTDRGCVFRDDYATTTLDTFPSKFYRLLCALAFATNTQRDGECSCVSQNRDRSKASVGKTSLSSHSVPFVQKKGVMIVCTRARFAKMWRYQEEEGDCIVCLEMRADELMRVSSRVS